MQTEHATVVGPDGLRGTIVHEAQPAPDGASRVLVRLSSGHDLLVPQAMLEPRDDGSYYLPLSRAELERQTAQSAQETGERIVVPVIEERLQVERRAVETGRVRIQKHIHEREEVFDEPLLREEVEVERVTLNQPVDQATPVRYEGETLVIPLLEEVLVVEKRLMLREEVRISRRRTQTREPKHVTLRSEDVTIERSDPQP